MRRHRAAFFPAAQPSMGFMPTLCSLCRAYESHSEAGGGTRPALPQENAPNLDISPALGV